MAMSNEATVKLKLLLQNNISTPLARAKQQLSSGISEMKDKLAGFKESHAKAFSGIKDEIPGLGRAVSLLTNPYVAAGAAIVGVGVAIAKSTQMALDWQKGLAKINVTAQLSKNELAKLSDQLLTIGRRNVAPLEEIPDAFNKIISAGLNTKQSLAALEPTLRAAKAGFVDVSTVATAGVNVMNSSGEDINKVYDVLFATLNKGAAEMEDIASYLPKIVPAAKQAGFSLGETAGAFAFMTAQGQKAERATTLLENSFKVLSDPEKIEKFKKIGVSLYQDGKMRPFISIIGDLQKSLDGLTDEAKARKLKTLGLDTEAASAFAIMTQDVEKLDRTIGATVNSTGALNRAYDDAKTPMDSYKIVMNEVKAVMIGIGNYFLPIITKIGEGILGVVNYFKNLYNESMLFRDILRAIGAAFTFAFKAAMIPIEFIWNGIKTIGSAINWLISLLPGMDGGFSDMYKSVKPYLMWIWDFLGQIATIMKNIATLNFSKAADSIKNFKMPTIADYKLQIETELKQRKQQQLDESAETNATTDPTKDKNISGITDQVTGSAKQIKNITVNIDSFNKGGINTTNTELNNMNASQIENWFNDAMLRMIRNLEMSY